MPIAAASRNRIIAWRFFAAITFLNGGAIAQNSAPQAAQPASAAVQPAKLALPQIDTAEINKRVNESVGADIQTKVKAWQKELDRIEDELHKPNLRYSDLNGCRDDLVKLRTDEEGFGKKLEPPLTAIGDQVQKLPPAPVQDQPPEAEQAAQLRAELNFHLGILRSAQSTVDATHFRIEQLIDLIQDIRRKNFTNNLFQPVPGVFSAQTWEHAADYASLAAIRIEGLVKDWWNGSTDKQELSYLAAIALALFLALSFLGRVGVGRLRFWRDAGAPPFWRRASSAAGVILLRSLPVIVPIVFLYNAVEGAQPMPEKVGWLFYVGARALFIVVVVHALMTTGACAGKAAVAADPSL